jgi:hypothetical protein
MSLLSKLTIGAVAVLGAYALTGKGRAATKAVAGKSPKRRGSKPRAAAKSATAAGRTTERAAAHKTGTRKRPVRRPHARRVPATAT